jgi:hypothetical protein
VTWAKQNYDRVSGLANAGVVSRQDLDQAKSTLDTAQAQLQSLGAQVNEQQVQLHYYRWLRRVPASSAMFPSALAIALSLPPTHHRRPTRQPRSLHLRAHRKIGQLKMNLPVEIVDGASGNCSPPAASPSSRRKSILRRKPCWPKRQIANCQ